MHLTKKQKLQELVKLIMWKNAIWIKDDQQISGRYMYLPNRERYIIELDVAVVEDDKTTNLKKSFPVDATTPEWDGWKLIREAEISNLISG